MCVGGYVCGCVWCMCDVCVGMHVWSVCACVGGACVDV